jgi:hypothetical protein
MVWHKRNPQRGHQRRNNNVQCNNIGRTVAAGDSNTVSRDRRDHRHHRGHYTKLYHYLAVCLLAVTPAYAEGEAPEVSNSSNPVAAATGNVTNQAVQFQNNGAPSRQYFAAGSSCNGATMTFSPFYMGNDTVPMESDGYVKNNNWGAQLNFSIPLDGSMIEQCKQLASRHEQKMRLDYELVRALKCTQIMKAGFTFRPGSRVEVLCHDIVPIVSVKVSD